jgi:hypothetical protein
MNVPRSAVSPGRGHTYGVLPSWPEPSPRVRELALGEGPGGAWPCSHRGPRTSRQGGGQPLGPATQAPCRLNRAAQRPDPEANRAAHRLFLKEGLRVKARTTATMPKIQNTACATLLGRRPTPRRSTPKWRLTPRWRARRGAYGPGEARHLQALCRSLKHANGQLSQLGRLHRDLSPETPRGRCVRPEHPRHAEDRPGARRVGLRVGCRLFTGARHTPTSCDLISE